MSAESGSAPLRAQSDPAEIVDLFAGPRGWTVGLGMHGLSDVGLELDHTACQTACAAGHPVIRCDVTQYPTHPFRRRKSKVIASPVCTPFSAAGNQHGVSDLPLIHQAVHDLAHGRDTRAAIRDACRDDKSVLAAEPMRWLHDLRPVWACLEQVPAVMPLWKQYAGVLRGWGYSVWTGVLNAADYGVPQARRRAILIASRVRTVTAPEPTHTERPTDALFGPTLRPWVTMAEALGWGYTRQPAPTVTGGGTASGGAEPFGNASRRAMRAAMDNPGHWAWRKPSPTISGTVGHVGGKQAGGHLNLEPEEGAVLQTFPRDYPFQGNKGQRSLQIGNAVPPLLAAHIVAAAAGLTAPAPLALATG
ncbi:DNA cytosine methyltransferase [Streptomyces griseoflavus]|uniref:DNA cytosine methyltransferase n=1 Tax=Streptomyces griseoflavus TaxID=35619 RepID=UPI00381F52D9